MLEPWCEALGLDQRAYEELKSQTPAGSSVLFYGLKNRRLDFEAYKTWVMKKYSLPFLPDQALDDVNLLTQIQNYCGKNNLKFTEGHESLVFYQYNKTKYVACFYPEKLQLGKNEFLTLVSPTTFEIFKTFNANVEVSEVYEFTNTAAAGELFAEELKKKAS